MAENDIKIKDLSEALQISNNAEFVYTQDNGGSNTTFKAKATQLATKLNEGVTYNNLQTTSKTIVGAINEAAQGGGVDYATELPISSTDTTDTKSYIDTKTTLVKSASGSIIHIIDGGDNIPMKSLESEIVAVESGSGTKSPTNPYTISGFDSGIVTRCGKNLVVASDLRATATHDSVTFTKTDVGRFNVSGTNGNATYGGYLSNNASILLKAGHTYRISGNWSGLTPSSSTVRVDLRYESTIYLHENTESFTPTQDVVCYLGYRINSNYSVPNGTICSPCVTVSNSDTTYEAYNGNTYTFTFGQTVYGGHFDNKGNLVVTHGKFKISDLTWTRSTSYSNPFFYSLISDGLKNTMAISDSLTCISPTWAEDFASVSNNHDFCIGLYSSQIFIRADEYTDATTFSSAGGMGNTEIVYELATPVTLSITSQNIPTLSGENNIFSNCGDTDIEYFTSSADEVAGLIKASVWTEITGTLTAGNTSITLSSGDITSNSTINVFTDGGVDYTSITVTNGSVTLTFEESSSDLGVKVRVS